MARYDVRRHSAIECLAGKLSSNQIRNVVTLAGAGMCTSAGIYDWRSPKTGLFYNLKKYKILYPDVLLDHTHFLNNPDILYSLLNDNFFHNPLKPTLTHCFIKLLEVKGILLRHFTQNIDGMELMTGISPDKVVEAHGTLQRSYCIKCKTPYNYQWLVKQMENHPVPYCELCSGLVRPDIVLFGEDLSQDFHLRSFVDLPESDLLIVLGSSMQVEPFASLVSDAPLECPRLVINRSANGNYINSSGKNPQDSRGRVTERESEEIGNELVIAADCDTAVQDLVKLIGWEEDFQRVIRDVKLRKLYGDVHSVEVGVQTLPLLSEWEPNFQPIECPIRESRCSDYRGDSKVKQNSLTRIDSKLPITMTPAVKPIINVEPQTKHKVRRTKPTSMNSVVHYKSNGARRFCDTCYNNADCSPKHYSTYRK